MKKILCFISCLIVAVSCTQSPDLENTSPRDLSAVTRSITPHTTPYIDWEDTTKINIVGYGLVTLPWYNGAQGALPEYILNDYKRADGWELLYNFCADPVENAGGNKNYLIFYNKLSGKLRVFYYSKDIVTNGTTTVAQFRTSSPTRLFNFNDGYYSIPYYAGSGPAEVCTSNITTSGSSATSLGWNCFEVELAYDPIADNKHFHLGFYDQNIQSIALKGILNIETTGSIITTDVTNSVKPLLGLAGNAAGAAIQDAYNKGQQKKDKNYDKGKFGAALGSLGGKIVSTGLDLIFGSFLGIFDQQTELESKVELKTEGSATFTGSIQSNVASAIVPIQNLLIPGVPTSETDDILPLYNQSIGAWNVRNLPTVQLDDVLTPTIYPLNPQPATYKGYCVDYERTLRKLPFGKDDIVVNPETMACIRDYDVKVEYFIISKFDGKYHAAEGGNFDQYVTKCVYEESFTDQEWNGTPGAHDGIKDKDSTIYTVEYRKTRTMFFMLDDYKAEFENSSFSMPQYTFGKSVSDDAILQSLKNLVKYKQPRTRIYTNLMAKVSVIFYPKAPYADKPILSTKTFKPNITLYTVQQRPIFIYNPYMKPTYVSSYDLWERRWDWN